MSCITGKKITPQYFMSATLAWFNLLHELLNQGKWIGPRGLRTKELMHVSMQFPMRRPLVAARGRKLSYKFAAAEPLWYLSKSRKVEDIAKYNSVMRKFSDDGETLFGAYGPPFMDQVSYVIRSLFTDLHTRQAWLTIWRQNPPKSKDIPCTIALGYTVRPGGINDSSHRLNTHVFMRSSDAWLGVPYDWFSFSMLANYVLAGVNYLRREAEPDAPFVELGNLEFTAVSSHIYLEHLERAEIVLNDACTGDVAPLPDLDTEFAPLRKSLEMRRDHPNADLKGKVWWDFKPVW